jgi:hypothetical protein
MENSSENNNLAIDSISSVGAPKGNQNNKKGKLFYSELRKALVQQDQLNLRRIADKLVEKAIDGEPWAVKEIMDRVDGKAVQTTEVSGIDGDPVELKVIEFIIKHPD